MKKMPTLFKREFNTGHKVIIHNEVTPGCEWVLNGEGLATRKLDGTCTLIKDGRFYRRYDAKSGRTVPTNAIKCQENPDPITGHLPCWVPVSSTDKADKWFVRALEESTETLPDGTYELCGPHFNGNPEQYDSDILIRHGSIILEDVPRTFEGIMEYLETHYIEGIVFHRGNGEMCKIKRTDFQFEWNNSKTKIK